MLWLHACSYLYLLDLSIFQVVKCSRPESIANGNWHVFSSQKSSRDLGDYEFNSVVKYACNPGFYLASGNHSRVCLPDGEWSDLTPHCAPLQCPTLYRPENCELVVNGNTLNSSAEYRCYYGYRIRNFIGLDKYANNHLKRICTANGTWDKVEPICESEFNQAFF